MTQEELQVYFIEQCSAVSDSVIKLGSQQLSREDYMIVKKTLESRGGKWKGGSVQGFMFLNGNAGVVLKSLQAGETGNMKDKFQLFETPDVLADKLVKKVGQIGSAYYVLEPSAGNGQLIKAIHRVCPDVVVDAYEINPDCWGALEKLDRVVLHKSDFLKSSEDDRYKVIVANPPFAKNQDIRHFKKMWAVLSMNGKMSVIMSKHWTFTRDSECERFRNFLDRIGAEIEDVEEGAFRASGTNVPTVIVTVEKNDDNGDEYCN